MRRIRLAVFFLALLGAFAPPAPIQAQADLLTGLVSYWKLNETSGTRDDAHGTNDLTDNNTVGYAAGVLGNAASFINANSEYLSHTDNADLSMGDIDFTIAGWVQLVCTPSCFVAPLIAKGDLSSYTTIEYALVFDSDGSGGYKIRFQVGNGAGVGNQVYTDQITPGLWYYVLGWHDATANQIGVCANDVCYTTPYVSGSFDGGSVFGLGHDISVYNRYANGYINEVGIWKRVLDVDERTALYNSGNGLAYPFSAPVFTPASSVDITLPSGNLLRLDYAWTFGGLAMVALLLILFMLGLMWFGYDVVVGVWRAKQ